MRTALAMILALVLLAGGVGAPAMAEGMFPRYAKVGEVGAPSDHRYPGGMPESYEGKLMPEEAADGGTISILTLSKPFTCEIDDADAGLSGVYYVDSIQMVDDGLSLRYGSSITARGNIFLGLEGYHARGLALSDAAFDAPGNAQTGGPQAIQPANPAASNAYAPDGSYVEATGDVHVRTLPSLTGKSLGTIADGGRLFYAGGSSVDSRGVRWYKVYYKGGVGWVSSMYSRLTSRSWDDWDASHPTYVDYDLDGGWDDDDWGGYGSYVKATGEVNIRKSPSLTAKSLGTISQGSRLFFAGSTSTDARGVRWYKVYYKTGTGWVSSMYSKLVGWRWDD